MRALGLALAIAAAALAPRWLAGQVRPAAPPDADGARPAAVDAAFEPDAVEQVLDREVFVYPGDGRRDPFRPLLPGDPAGPRFEELRLIGVIFSPDPRQSVALVGVSTGGPSTPMNSGQQTFRLRQDDLLGDMVILRVEQEHVIVETRRFGMREQLELHLNRQHGRDGR